MCTSYPCYVRDEAEKQGDESPFYVVLVVMRVCSFVMKVNVVC